MGEVDTLSLILLDFMFQRSHRDSVVGPPCSFLRP